MSRLVLSILVVIILVSCSSKNANTLQVKSDTLLLLEKAISMGSTGEHMPGAGPLTTKFRFGDSILLTSQVLPLDRLPTNVNGLHYKVLPMNAICSLVKADSTFDELPNYLSVQQFEKSDAGYMVQMISRSCQDFGGGGSLILFFKKVKDSLVLVDQGSSSLN